MVLAAAVLVMATIPVSAAARASTVTASVLGAYTGYGNVSADQAIGSVLGQPLAFGSDYIPYAQGWSGMTNPDIESRWANSGLRMVYGLPMFPTTCVIGSAACWNAGADGSYDSYFVTVAQNLVHFGQGNAIIRIGWEFNVPGEYSWYAAGYSAQFVQYWQNIVTAMRSVPGADFVFDWNPNIGSAISDLMDYYPGSSYVGSVGFDIYDMGWKTYPGPLAVWQNYLTEREGLDWLVSFGNANNEPLSLPEWGLGFTTLPAGSGNVGGGDDPYFVTQIANFIASNNVIEAGLWDSKGQLPNASQNPNATAALISAFSS
ncbi:MAG TPA: hypothetical protein DEH11_06175 [Actinobacteria bacterium]|jgi:hypothetical protein|nr:hypothetical protein [Actinomycetota bacterium]